MERGKRVLRAVLRRMRNEKQGGYTDVADGKFEGHATFISCSLPQTTPKELDALFELAGIVPDAIEPLGSCDRCVHATADGGSAGWSPPCCGCAAPKMTNFVPVSRLTKKSLMLTPSQRELASAIQRGDRVVEDVCMQQLIKRGLARHNYYGRRELTLAGVVALKQKG